VKCTACRGDLRYGLEAAKKVCFNGSTPLAIVIPQEESAGAALQGRPASLPTDGTH
jgi:hypothetical protein